MNESVYLNLLNDAEQDLEIYKARSYKLSVVRLLLFTLFLTFLIIYLFNKQSLLLLSSLLFLGGFITFIIKHDQVIKKIKYLNLRIETIRSTSIASINGGPVLRKLAKNSMMMGYPFYTT